jgi:hypothetical protein
VTLSDEARALFAVEPLHLYVSIVECIREMSRCAAGHSTADCTVVEHDNSSAFSREKISCRHAGDTCTDDTNVRSDIFS